MLAASQVHGADNTVADLRSAIVNMVASATNEDDNLSLEKQVYGGDKSSIYSDK